MRSIYKDPSDQVTTWILAFASMTGSDEPLSVLCC